MASLPTAPTQGKPPCAQNAGGIRPPEIAAPACAPDDAQPASERIFSKVVQARIRNLRVLGGIDFKAHVAHALLSTAIAAHTVHLTYHDARQVVQLQVRLDLPRSVLPQSVEAVLRARRSASLGKMVFDSELRAVFVSAASVLLTADAAEPVLSRLVEVLRSLLGDRDLLAGLGLI